MEQIYIGTHPHAIDAQRRVAIPREWRQGEKGEALVFYQLPGRHGTIQVLPESHFRQEILEKIKKVSFADAAKSRALATIGAKASRCTCDKQGRVTLTPELMEHAGLTDQAVMVGSFTTIQVMAPERWSENEMSTEDVLDQIQRIHESGEL
jgi:MraZ protein